MVIGEQTAEKVKKKLGAAINPKKQEKMDVTGRDSVTGLPRQVEIFAIEVCEAIREPLNKIVGMVKAVMEEVPPELSSDIIDKGVVMSGGTACLKNFDKFITQETGVPAFVAEDPLRCVVKGVGIAMENLELYKKNFVDSR